MDRRATQLFRGCSELCHGDWSAGVADGASRGVLPFESRGVGVPSASTPSPRRESESFPRGRVDAVAAQIACPDVAKITLYTVISGSLTALAFVRSNEDCGGDLNDAFFRLPYLYARAMIKRARQNSMFAVAGLSVAFTWGYLLWSVPHIVGYMSSH